MDDITPFMQTRFNDLFSRVADRCGETFLDEEAIQYEAARLERNAVVLVFYFDGADYERGDFSSATNNLFVAKGDAECKRYFRGETDSLEFEAVLALNARTAWALRDAFQRRATKLRLVK